MRAYIILWIVVSLCIAFGVYAYMSMCVCVWVCVRVYFCGHHIHLQLFQMLYGDTVFRKHFFSALPSRVFYYAFHSAIEKKSKSFMHTKLNVMPMAVSRFIVRFLTNLFLVFVKAKCSLVRGAFDIFSLCNWMQSHCNATICLQKSYESEKDEKNGWTRICLLKIFVFSHISKSFEIELKECTFLTEFWSRDRQKTEKHEIYLNSYYLIVFSTFFGWKTKRVPFTSEYDHLLELYNTKHSTKHQQQKKIVVQ